MLESRIVKPIGPSESKIVFIGEAPGEQEDQNGVPFWPYAPAGGLLMRCFKSVGLKRDDVLLGNVFCQRPPDNNIGYFFNDKKRTSLVPEAHRHINSLRNWLTELSSVNVIVSLGDIPLRILTGKQGIYKWRGSVLPCTLVPGLKVYPTFHPSHVMRLMNEKTDEKFSQNVLPTFLIDLKRAMIQAESPKLPDSKRNFKVLCSLEEIEKNLKGFYPYDCVSVDIETIVTPKGPVMWMIGFAITPTDAFTIPIRWNGKPKWSLKEEVQIWRWISDLMENPRVKKIFQNGLYDMTVMAKYYGIRFNNIADTMLCHHNSHPYLEKSLGYLTSIYTWNPYHKDEGYHKVGQKRFDRAEAIYNCKDTTCTFEIWPNVSMDSRELGCWNSYKDTMSFVPSLMSMMLRGVKVDAEKKESLHKDYSKRLEELQEQINLEVGYHLNVRSSQQKSRFLFEERGYEGSKRSRITGDLSSDNDVLLQLRRKYPEDEVLRLIMEYQKYAILVSTFLEMPLSPEGRAHTSYSWVSTFRLNSKKSSFGSGGNLQNIPGRTPEGKEVRKMFVPDPGKVMVASDLGGAEAMVVAWESQDLEDIDFFLNLEPGGIHWKRAKEVFGFPRQVEYNPIGIIKDNYTNREHSMKFYRNVSKTIVHATNYGMGIFMMLIILARQNVFFPYGLAKQISEDYKRKKVSLMKWQQSVRDKLHTDGYIISSIGQKRFFKSRMNDATYRAAYAFSPQNTVGRLIQYAIRDIWNDLPYIEPLLNVHDEVVCQIDPKDLERSIKDIRSVMERPLEIHNRELIIPADFKIGPSWGDLKEI